MRQDVPERAVPPGVPELPVARGPVHHHEGDEDAQEEEDEHGVLHELDVLRVEPGVEAVAAPERVVVVDEVAAGAEAWN